LSLQGQCRGPPSGPARLVHLTLLSFYSIPFLFRAMASAPSVLVRSVRRKSAAERRAQQLRSDARCLQKLLGGLLEVQGHRGNQLSKVGKSLLEVIQRSAPEPTHSPPAEALKREYATFVPGASSHPDVAKVDEFVDRLVRSGGGPSEFIPSSSSMSSSSSVALPSLSTLVLEKKVRSSEDSKTTPEDMEYIDLKKDLEQMMPTDDGPQAARRPLPDASRPTLSPSAAEKDEAALLELMDIFDNPDSWNVINNKVNIDFSRITNQEVGDAIRDALHDLAGKADDVQNRLRKVQHVYLESRETFATLMSDATLSLGDTEQLHVLRATHISKQLALLEGMEQCRREYKEAAAKHKANDDQLMVIAVSAYVD